jgi:hypothetical protein
MVRPHLEYANQVRCPHLAKHKDEIENVQRRATKQLPGNLRMATEIEVINTSLSTYTW